MTYIKKSLSFLLVISLLISSMFLQFSFNVSAETRQGIVIADTLIIREKANKGSKELGSIPGGTTVQINSETKGQTITDKISSDIWYNITYNKITGFVSSVYITLIPEYNNDPDFEKNISAFPESYKPYLRTLHAQYPNWRFTPDNINMTLDEAVALEGTSKLIYYTDGSVSRRSMGLGGYDWKTKKWAQPESGYYVASREVVKYYMDPRTYLNTSSIYAFLPQNYDSASQTEEGVKKIIKGTFLENEYSDPKDTTYDGSYSKVLIAAAKSSGVNPYVLAATIIQEQGRAGTSPMISGTYKGYEGTYNFFNVQATGSTETDIYVNGLKYAKNKGWTTRSASIIGGAEFCADNYVSANQNTYYYMNFNIKNPSHIWHQYAQAIHDTASKAANVAESYSGMTDSALNFLIPVYKDTSESATAMPEKNNKKNNYYFASISVAGLTPSFSMFTQSYDLNVLEDTNISVSVPAGASYVSEPQFSLKVGQNTVVLSVKSESGYTNNYVINVRADKACTLYVKVVDKSTSEPEVTYKKGDTNGDGKINGRDLANVQMHILSVKALTGDTLKAADTNGDGKINGRDLANIQMDILGKKKLN